MLQVNTIFNKKYRVLEIIGKGGMGRVYLAEHTSLKNKWAIKELLLGENSPIDLLAEPNILKQLNHSSLPRIVDIVEQNNTLYIIMDYIDGKSLRQELKERKKFSEREVIEFGKQLCEVYIYLHNHKPMPIIYRDMKPDNVMITKDGKLKVIDFGIAREFKEESIQDTVLGYTKGYAAPEQQNKNIQSDGRTDIYSLGVTLYHLLTGKSPYEPPYDFTKVRDIDSSLSEGIEIIIKKCVQANPEDRYQNAEELLYDFNNIYKLNSTYILEKKKYLIKRIVSLLICFFSISLTFFGVNTMALEKHQLYNSLIEEGLALTNQSKFDDGILKFEEAKNKISKKIDSYIEISRTYLYKKEYEKCISYINDEVFLIDDNFQNDDKLLYILGTAYFNLNQYDKSTYYFKKASDINGTEINYKRDLAVSLGKENKISEAEAVIEDIKKNNGSEGVTSYVEGEINSVKKNYTDAIKSFEKSLELSTDEEIKLKSYKAIAKLYNNNPNNFNNATELQVAILEKAFSDLKDTKDAELIELRGASYYKQAENIKADNDKYVESLKKSLSCFQNLIDMGYKMPYLYTNVASIYYSLGDYYSSEKVLLEVIKLYPDYVKGYSQLALLYVKMEESKLQEERDYAKAMEQYNLALRYSKDGENSQELKPLINVFTQLRANGWIK